MTWTPRPWSRAGAGFVLVVAMAAAAVDARAGQAPGSGSGVVEGRVVDAANGSPLPAAAVIATGTAAQTSTDRDGLFRLTGAPAGDRTVVVAMNSSSKNFLFFRWSDIASHVRSGFSRTAARSSAEGPPEGGPHEHP